MGKNLDQILAEVADGDSVGVTIVTNQDNGIASYAVGSLIYSEAKVIDPFIFVRQGLSTAEAAPLQFFFSDRTLDIDPPGPLGVSDTHHGNRFLPMPLINLAFRCRCLEAPHV